MPAGRVAAVRRRYQVRARRWARGWELHIDGVGVTQSRTLATAETMVRDYIAVDLDLDPEAFDLEITAEVGDGLDAEVTAVRRDIREAERALAQAAERSRALARALADKGITGRDVARVLGVSPQRVSQLLKAGTATAGSASATARRDSRPGRKAA